MKLFFLSLLISTILFIFGGSVFAQQTTGCLFNGIIYYTLNGTSGGVPNYRKPPQGATLAIGSAYCVVNIGGNCRIDKKASQVGTLTSFYLVPCPFDDYVPILILLIGGIGLFRLRNLPIKNLLLQD